MQLILGMQCVYPTQLAARRDALAKLAALATDSRWIHRFERLIVGTLPLATPAPTVRSPIPADRLAAVAADVLTSPVTATATFSVSKLEKLDHAHFHIDIGRKAVHEDGSPMFANARARLPEDANANANAAAWVELQHAIVEALGVTHGVIITATNPYVMSSELWLSRRELNGKVMHPHPEEISSYAVRRHMLGNEYIRKPRWGTYLKPAHVAAIGGRDKLVGVVEPPVVREVGELLYVQLSEHVADATAPATRARYQKFAALVAPITMPPKPA